MARMGRPPKEETTDNTAHVDVLMPPALRRKIRLAALRGDTSMAAWLREAAEEKLQREPEPPAYEPTPPRQSFRIKANVRMTKPPEGEG